MLSWDFDNCGHSVKSKIKMFLCLRQVKDIWNSDFVFRKQSDQFFLWYESFGISCKDFHFLNHFILNTLSISVTVFVSRPV